jgi:hypothetical protein
LKSIFKEEVLPPNNTTTLWVHRSPQAGLWFRSEAAQETGNETFCVSMTGNHWQAEFSHHEADWIPIEGIYGVYQVPSGIIWVLITTSERVYDNGHVDIRRVHSLELVHTPHGKHSISQRMMKEQARQVRLLRDALRHHTLYFSGNGIDMTHTLQRSILSPLAHILPDSRFYWNEPSVNKMLETSSSTTASQRLKRHVIPVTSAFVGVQSNLTFSDRTYDEVLISRRNRFRAGTRFTKRGADATGAVANYAETEQVCWLYSSNSTLEQVSSHVQTRGSIPLRWSSPADVKTYRPRVRIGTDPLAQARAMWSHLQGEFAHYASAAGAKTTHAQLVFLNLIDKKQDQGRLGRAFDAVLNAVLDVYSNTTSELPVQSVQHVWFDFHAQVKHGKWERLESLLRDLTPTLEEQGYFCAIPAWNGTWTVLRSQRGVVRTNCMDCLDRTNVVQSIFGRYMLYRQLDGIRSEQSKRALPLEYAVAFRRNPMTLPWIQGEVAHRLLWADNADAISKLYAGTAALKGDFTRTGKRTRRGALDDGMNSLQRYYLNNFLDADRQEGMDLMVGHADFSTDDSFDPVSLEKARSLLLSSSDESKYALMKQRKRRRVSEGLDLRWLPGDLQSHMKSHAWGVTQETKEALESMDQRSASDQPWWVISEDSSSAEEDKDEDDDELMVLSSANTGTVIGALVAALQAPTTTATAVVCILGLANSGTRSAKDKRN